MTTTSPARLLCLPQSEESTPPFGLSPSVVSGFNYDDLPNFVVTNAIPKFDLHPRVLDQLDDVRMGPLQGQLTPDDLQGLINNASALRVVNASSGHISVIQEVDGVLLRITTAADEFKIISVGPIRPNQVANRLADGGYIEIPTLPGG